MIERVHYYKLECKVIVSERSKNSVNWNSWIEDRRNDRGNLFVSISNLKFCFLDACSRAITIGQTVLSRAGTIEIVPARCSIAFFVTIQKIVQDCGCFVGIRKQHLSREMTLCLLQSKELLCSNHNLRFRRNCTPSLEYIDTWLVWFTMNTTPPAKVSFIASMLSSLIYALTLNVFLASCLESRCRPGRKPHLGGSPWRCQVKVRAAL